MGASAFVEQNDVSQRLQRPVVRVRRVPRDVAQRGRLEGGSIANGSGVSEGVDGIDPERAPRGLDAGEQSRAKHYRG